MQDTKKPVWTAFAAMLPNLAYLYDHGRQARSATSFSR